LPRVPSIRRLPAAIAFATALGGCDHDFAFLDDRAGPDVADATADASVDVPTDAAIDALGTVDHAVVVDTGVDAHVNAMRCSPERDAGCPSCGSLGSSVGTDLVTGTNADAPSQMVSPIPCLEGPAGTEINVGAGPEVTFAWTAPVSGAWSFDTAGSTYDTVVYVIDYDHASCGGGVLACADDSSSSMFQACSTVHLVQGQTVVIVLDGYSPTMAGEFHLSIYEGSGPAGHCQ
jgi:hypothetical protein